jgi:hypothetical protein
MTNPFIDSRLFLLYLVALVFIGVASIQVMRRNWIAERKKLRQAILRHLDLPVDERGLQAVRHQVLALVPCRRWVLRKYIARPLSGERIWLCFLAGGLLLVFGKTGNVVDLTGGKLEKLHLVDNVSTRGFAIKIETKNEFMQLEVQRLADMVRIVNVLIKLGIPLGY